MLYTTDDLADYTQDELLSLRADEQGLLEWHSCPTPDNRAGRARAKQDAIERARISANIATIDSLMKQVA